ICAVRMLDPRPWPKLALWEIWPAEHEGRWDEMNFNV
ncbi:hypothetical protein AVEN_35551-1, partial [Araneus ventricosus]